MQITDHVLHNWADEGGIPDLALAELDYRLVHALGAIYTDPFLRDRLYLKGGTALNKLYLPGASRLSVDLDFNFYQASSVSLPAILRSPSLGAVAAPCGPSVLNAS